MRHARIWLIGFAGLLLLALLAIWQVPQWLDWTRYRSTIEVLATTMIGRPVAIQGPIALTVLPDPSLTAMQVEIGGSSSDVSIHVTALRLRVSLWPLLAGHVEARDLVLRGANVRIPRLVEASVLRAHPPEWLGAFSARIEDGSFSVGQLGVSGIDATLISSDTGAFSAIGSGKFNGQDWHFSARLTSPGADGAAGLNATLDGQGKAAGLGASVTGQLGGDGGFHGNVSSRGPNLSMLVPAPPVAFRADGRLTIGGGLAIADNLVLEIGGSPATGAVALRTTPMQRLDIALSASRLDLNAWLPVLLNAHNSVGGLDLPIGLNLSADAAPLGGDLLENARAAFELSDQVLVLRDGSALLPGNGTLRLSGMMRRADASHPHFAGTVRLDAPVLRTTLQWLCKAVPGWLPDSALSRLPDSVLQHATFAGHVSVDHDAVLLQNVKGTLDGSTIAGSLGIRRGTVPAFSADLIVDHASLDDWVPTSVQVPKAVDLDLRLALRTATLRGYTLHDVALDAGVTDSALNLRHFEATLNGLQVSALGKLEKDGRIGDGKLTMMSQDARPLAAMLPANWRATPALWDGPIQLSLQAAGPPSALGVTVKLALDDARLDATPTINLSSGAWNGELTVRHPGARRLLSALGLPGLTGLSDLPDWLSDGSLSLIAHLDGTAGQVAAGDYEVTAGALRFGGNVTLSQSDGEPHLRGQLHVDSLPIPQLSAASSVPLPFGLLHGWQGDIALTAGRLMFDDGALHDVSASVSVDDGALRIERFTGKLGGGTLSGTCLINGAANPPTLAVQAHLTGATLTGTLAGTPIDLIDGDMQGSMDLTASGYSPATLVSTVTGRLALTVTNGAITGFDLSGARRAAQQVDPVAAQRSADDALNGGTTRFDKLDIAGTLAHGSLTLDTAHLQSSAGEATATGDDNLSGGEVNTRIVLRPAVPNPPEIGVQLTGPIDHPQRTLDLANLARFVAERVR